MGGGGDVVGSLIYLFHAWLLLANCSQTLLLPFCLACLPCPVPSCLRPPFSLCSFAQGTVGVVLGGQLLVDLVVGMDRSGWVEQVNIF